MASYSAVTSIEQAYNLTCYKKSFQSPLVVCPHVSDSPQVLLPNAIAIACVSAAGVPTPPGSTTTCKALQTWMKQLTRDSCDVLVVQLPPSSAGTVGGDSSLADAVVVALSYGARLHEEADDTDSTYMYDATSANAGAGASGHHGQVSKLADSDAATVRAVHACIHPLAHGELLPGVRFKEVYLIPHSTAARAADEYPLLCAPQSNCPRLLPALPWRVPLPKQAQSLDPRVTSSTVLGPLYLSAWEQASDGQALVQAGIGAVLNCATLAECSNAFEHTGLPQPVFHWSSSDAVPASTVVTKPVLGWPVVYQCLGLEDASGQELQQAITTAVAFIRRHRRAGHGRGVLIHCAQGLSRSVSILLAYLMMDYGLSYHQAREVVEGYRQHGSRASPNAGFRRQLMALDGVREDGGHSGYDKDGLYPLASPCISPTASGVPLSLSPSATAQLPALGQGELQAAQERRGEVGRVKIIDNAPLTRAGSRSLLEASSPPSRSAPPSVVNAASTGQ